MKPKNIVEPKRRTGRKIRDAEISMMRILDDACELASEIRTETPEQMFIADQLEQLSNKIKVLVEFDQIIFGGAANTVDEKTVREEFAKWRKDADKNGG